MRIRISFLVIVLSASWISAQTTPQWGSYPERPLNLIDLIPPDGRRFSLGHDFDYIDQSGRAWQAPLGFITDGASIPMPFWSVIGGPYEGLYREAAVVHDAGCCAQTVPWQDVHHMFYNAMRCSGVSRAKAKTMFFAVWVGGPRWTTLNTGMPAVCKLSPPVKASIQTKLLRIIRSRPLTSAETKAVARPFFTNRTMTQAGAAKLVSRLKQRRVTPEEERIIALSVIQSEQFSDDDVKQVESWSETEKPSLETTEARAEQTRKQKQEKSRKGASFKANMRPPRLFREIPELSLQSGDNSQ